MEIKFPLRWAPQHPDRIQLYSLATPNGQKASIALEELSLPYEAHRIDIMADDQFDPEYIAINPNSKIPSIIDPNGPNGEPIAIMESAAILLYLSDKAGGALNPPEHRWETLQWLSFQIASVGPFFGQFGHFFKFARDKTSDRYSVERYTKEAKRLLGVLNTRLEGRTYLVGETYTIADIATFPWVTVLDFYEGKSALEYESFEYIEPWVQRCLSRDAVQRGVKVCEI